MPQDSSKIANRLRLEGIKNLEFFRAIPEDAWDKQIYFDGAQWNVLQLLIHIVEVEEDIPRLVRSIVLGGKGVSEDFDLDRYNELKIYEIGEVPPDLLIEQFEKRRNSTIEMVEAFSSDDLEISGNHPFLGQSQVHEMLRLMYLHIQLHIKDLKVIIEN